MSKILVPTDFSPAADNAMELACRMAAVGNQEIVLFHVLGGATEKLLKKKGKSNDELESYMQEICQKAKDHHAVNAVVRIDEGSLIPSVVSAASEFEMEWMIMGTHGTRGLRQALFGADALKIAEKSPIPVLTVPDVADVSKGINRILFPFGGHASLGNKVKAVGVMAQSFNAEVEFYSIDRPDSEIDKSVYSTITQAEQQYTNEGVPHKRVIDEARTYSVGFAKQTLAHAEEVGANIIAVMASDESQLSFISGVDRENLINNDSGISILLVAE